MDALRLPGSIAVDAQDNVYVTEAVPERVQKFRQS
jgi:hypothetical protein